MNIKNKKISILLFLFLFTAPLVSAQTFSVPHFENINLFYGLNTKPYITANSLLSLKLRFSLSHICYFDLDINAKINKLIDFFSPIQSPKEMGDFSFYGASLNFPNINNRPISLGIFTGIYDSLGSDSILQEHLKIKMSEPEFRKHYPSSAFRPRNFIQGTGLGLYGTLSSGFYMGIYAYWNEKLKNDLRIKSDFRMGGSFDFFAFDFFAGAAFSLNISETKLRTGFAMLFNADTDYEFFAEAGLSEIKLEKPSLELFVSNFYASFEARIKKDFMSSSIACFVSPVFLLPASISDPSLKDSFFTGISTNLSFGNIETHNMAGGINLMGSLNPLKPAVISSFSFLISPFYTFRIGRFECDFRLPVNPLLYNNIPKMVTGQISIKAVY